LAYALAVLFVSGAMALVVSALIDALKTGVIHVGRTGKISRGDAPLVYWLIIFASVGIIVVTAVNLVLVHPH
jgi:hypothetical protein